MIELRRGSGLDQALDNLPFTPIGVGVISTLVLAFLVIIGYLFRLIGAQRKTEQARISAVEADYAARLKREQEDRDALLERERAERDKAEAFFQQRVDRVSERYEREVAALRSELVDVRQQLTDVRLTADNERRLREQAERKLADVEAELRLRRPVRRAGP